MIPGFEDLLRCPLSGGALRLQDPEFGDAGRVKTGRLVSERGTQSYAIREYVPVFAGDDDYAGSFGRQWTRWTTDVVLAGSAGLDLANHYRRKYADITGLPHVARDGDLVVEVGAGSGMFVGPVRETGARYIGLDLSQSVFSAQAEHLADPKVQFVKADAFAPPLERGRADAAFSIGVFHHTPDPGLATRTMLTLIRSGGHYGISVYSHDGYHGQTGVRRLRRAYEQMSGEDRERFALGYAIVASKLLYPVLGLLMQDPRRKERVLRLQRDLAPSFSDEHAVWRATVLHDAITPVFASTHDPQEVADWLRAGGAATWERRPWPSVAFAGSVA